MEKNETHLVSENLKTFLEAGNKSHLRSFLNDQYPQDLAEALKGLPEKEKVSCFLLLDMEHAGDVLSELNHETQKKLIKIIGSKKLAPIISEMEIDDVTDLVGSLEEKEKSELIEVLPDPIQQAHLKELMDYPPDSAGGIMTTNFLRLRSDMTIQGALNHVRRQVAEQNIPIYYLYVVDNKNTLVGVITLKDLICSPLDDLISNYMNKEIIKANIKDDRETVAKTISKYDLIAIPIVDDENELKGIVTFDDVVDIISEETTEDIYHGSGIGDVSHPDELILGKVNYAVKARLPWLLITLFGEAIAAYIIAFHNITIINAPIAISFMPLLSGLSGNVGGQTATIIVRGLVTGDVDLKNTFKHIFHELKIGLLLGFACAIITGIIAWKLHNTPILGLVVACALLVTMTTGVLLGTVFPILLQYFKKDPAAACSPLITTLLDVFTFTFYLSIISMSIGHLH